jgi:hypothetical protein
MPRPRLWTGSPRRAVTAIAVLASLATVATAGELSNAAATTTATPVWTQLPVTSSPEWGSGAVSAYDPDTRQTLLFGGEEFEFQSGDFSTNVTWQWDAAASTWTRLTPITSPPERDNAAMAFDAATHQLLLFGGYDAQAGADLDDTWQWTGSTWSRLITTSHPPDGSSMAYDTATKQLLALGGGTASGGAQTWSWTGTDWVQLAPPTQLPAAIESVMAFDRAVNRMLQVSWTATNAMQTWAWNGKTWAQLPTSAGTPGPLRAAVMAFDPALNATILVGLTTTSPQTWAYANGAWAALPGVPSTGELPSAMVYNGAQGQLLLFAPLNYYTTPDNETWALNAPTTTALVAAPTNPTPGGTVTLSATVTTAKPLASAGKVKFLDNGAAITGCLARPLQKGVATCITKLTAGHHSLTAVYVPASGYLASTSTVLALTVG